MGLDITLYKGIKLAEKATDDAVHLFNVDGCTQNVGIEGYYTSDGREHVFGSPYSTYNMLRASLAKLIGTTDRKVWEDPKPGTPFLRLIDFSDCEGAFDTGVCKELAEHFKEWEGKAMECEDEQFKNFYNQMKYAFTEAAANNGAVVFH